MQSEELENGIGGIGEGNLPDWAGMVEEVQYNIITLREKTKRVAALQSNLVRRPSLDDNTEEERQLTAHTNEIRRVGVHCEFFSTGNVHKMVRPNPQHSVMHLHTVYICCMGFVCFFGTVFYVLECIIIILTELCESLMTVR